MSCGDDLPGHRADRPNRDFLEWHLDEVFKSMLRTCGRAEPLIDHSLPRGAPAWVARARYVPKPARRSMNPQLRWPSVARLQDGCSAD
jgi:hypothetical protein